MCNNSELKNTTKCNSDGWYATKCNSDGWYTTKCNSCGWKYETILNCTLQDYDYLNCLIDQFLPIGKETYDLSPELLNKMLEDTIFTLNTCVLFNNYVFEYIKTRLYYRTRKSWNTWRINNKIY